MQLLTLTVKGSSGTDYEISVNPKTGKAQCSCMAFRYSKGRKACKHMDFALQALMGSPAAAPLVRAK